MKTHHRIEFANTLRGFAALAVLISHYFGFFWNHRDLSAKLTNTAILPIENYATPFYVSLINFGAGFDWGAYAVGVFFLISGFVIPFSLKQETLANFVMRRLCRIVPTYAVGFSITLLMIWIGGEYFLQSWPYTFSQVAVHYVPGIRDLLLTPRIDGIIWTLELEMKFYAVCAAMIIWFRRDSLKVFLLPLGLFIIAMWIGSNLDNLMQSPTLIRQAVTLMFIAQHLIYFFIGVVFHYFYQNRLSTPKATLLVVGVFALFMLLWWFSMYRVEFAESWNYGLSILTFALAYRFRAKFTRNPIFDFFADISFPLYVIHAVSGMVALRILIDQDVPALLAIVIVTAMAIALAWILHKVIEVPSIQFAKKWSTKNVTQTAVGTEATETLQKISNQS